MPVGPATAFDYKLERHIPARRAEAVVMRIFPLTLMNASHAVLFAAGR
jgi:hypothetical protein